MGKLNVIQKMKCETQILELKAAEKGCPKRLYDSLSSFSNQDEGGVIVFGVDEEYDYKEVGVYDPQDIQKKINEQCLQMEPVVRPLLTVVEKDEKFFVSAEIPGIDLVERPCHYKGQGRLKGSYTRIGDSDEPMTEYEVYSYEALKVGKPNLATIEENSIYELMSIKRDGEVTLSAAMQFVRKNMRNKTIINPENGMREDRQDYPIIAIREAIVNALVHRDYSIHTEGMPIQIIMFEDRMEIRNPGGLYGRIRVDQLGKVQLDTRNPMLASSLEVLGITENRYSGIPTIKKEMKKYNLREPEFLDERGNFVVKFYKEVARNEAEEIIDEETNNLLIFCKTPRTRQEICDYLGLSSVTYAIQKHIMPLVESGKIKLSIPDKPKSPKQLYFSE